MDSAQFKSAIDAVSDEIINYIDTVHTRRVMSNVEPGYLKKLLPDRPPEDGERWDEIQKDIESKIMPGMTHWNSPNFMAYFPAPTTYPSMLGELYSSALAVSAFNWDCAPAVTELEVIVMDWLAKIINLPPCFLSSGNGGGVIQGTTSEAILALMVAARERYLHQTTAHLYGVEKETAIAQRRLRMVALGSEASHSCTQKAAMIIGMRYRSIPVYLEDGFSMTGDSLRDTLKQCEQEGLEPFYLTTTLGTTATCAVDKFDELAQVLRGHQIWVHVDAAYAGSALVCEEHQSLTEHLGEFDSFSMSMSKWLLTNIDAVCCFIKNKHHLVDALSITPAYLRNDASDSGAVVDFRHWGVPLSRRFRALKIWFVMRTYGVNGFKAYIRNHIELGHLFASLVASRPNLFRIVTPPAFALTVISIVPRVPALLRQYMAIKAKELKLKKEPRTNGVYHVNGEPKVNGMTHINSKPKRNGEVVVNGRTDTREKIHSNGEFKTKEETHVDGGPKINGISRSNGMSYTNGTAAILEEPHIHGDPRMNQEPIINGIIDVNEKIGINGKPGTKVEPYTNGVTKVNSAIRANGTSTINGEPKLNGLSRINANPTANNEATSCTEEWYTEYANMVTKAVYDLVNRQGEIMLTSTVIGGLFVIRVNSANPKTEEKYLRRAFEILVAAAEEVLDGA